MSVAKAKDVSKGKITFVKGRLRSSCRLGPIASFSPHPRILALAGVRGLIVHSIGVYGDTC